MTKTPLPVPTSPAGRVLTAAAFQGLTDVPPEMEWFANLGNRATRRAYEAALKDFMRFTGIERPEEFRGPLIFAAKSGGRNRAFFPRTMMVCRSSL
jgi:hypothetical protein